MEEIKCAIYTRKSTDEGLEKEFNTLEAQREAGENYVKSQKHQGWILVDEHYDDGGFSGGNMKRPALQRLFKDIELGKINMIVVYKIDRLTRSLVDFSKMVDIFDKYHCSFVSVTQNFNTSDSMGRLTLNNHYECIRSFLGFRKILNNQLLSGKKNREEIRKKILKLLSDNPHMTMNELAIALEITPKSVEWKLYQLVKEKKIKRLGATKKGQWVVKKNILVKS